MYCGFVVSFDHWNYRFILVLIVKRITPGLRITVMISRGLYDDLVINVISLCVKESRERKNTTISC